MEMDDFKVLRSFTDAVFASLSTQVTSTEAEAATELSSSLAGIH